MQKECAQDADLGVRAGCKLECALDHPPRDQVPGGVLLGTSTGLFESQYTLSVFSRADPGGLGGPGPSLRADLSGPPGTWSFLQRLSQNSFLLSEIFKNCQKASHSDRFSGARKKV